jgi:hypothetical protein
MYLCVPIFGEVVVVVVAMTQDRAVRGQGVDIPK